MQAAARGVQDIVMMEVCFQGVFPVCWYPSTKGLYSLDCRSESLTDCQNISYVLPYIQ